MFKIIVLIFHLYYIIAHRHHNIEADKNITFIPTERTCNVETCPEDRGICSLDDKCYCLTGYTTVKDTKYGNFDCNYNQKSQMVAFLLEFLLSFGSGHFYINNYAIAIPKFIFCTSFIVITCVLPLIASRNKNRQLASFVPYFQCLAMVLFCSWQIFDSILFGLNRYKDGNGIKLEGW